MRRRVSYIFFVLLGLMLGLLSSCNTTKFVPQDKQLLNKVKITVEDTKAVAPKDLKSYLRQTNNSEILGFWKLQLHIYNTAPLDTTTKSKKRLAANAFRIGQAPEIFDTDKADASCKQIQKAMQNEGFFHATVDTTMKEKDRKVWLTYHVKAKRPYTIRKYSVDLKEAELRYIALSPEMLIHAGERFSTQKLDDERQRITSRMRQLGYYNFDKSYLQYEADSSHMNNDVDVELSLSNLLLSLPDSLRGQVFRQYAISRVFFHTDYAPENVPDSCEMQQSEQGDYVFTWIGSKPMLRNRTLIKNCHIRPGEAYDETKVEQTYALLNALGPVKYVDISFDYAGTNSLDCHIVISRSKPHSISAEVEGTYASGDWGVSAGLGYTNRNIFRGAEEFSIKGSGLYEWRQGGGRAIEGKGEASLRFPNSLQIKLNYSYQKRPDEFTRQIANAGLYYTIHRPRSYWTHRFNCVDISYVYLPWISDQFRKDIIDKSNMLRFSYDDHLILGWSYQGQYNTSHANNTGRSYMNLVYQLETAGNFLYGISRAFLKEEQDHTFKIFNVHYAQYAKADINFTYNQLLAEHHRLVYHAAIGVAYPYLNASSVPFEKRYFSGGANSVRGWAARSLGPGGFRTSDGSISYDLQAGDIRLDLNLEYRWKVIDLIELAAFVDAGNNWTIFEYASQPHGVFRWDEFYRQIALSYGVGIRLDFNVLIFRVDFGVKLYDPSRLYGTWSGTQWRTAANGLCWKDDMTFHFAIGYPF